MEFISTKKVLPPPCSTVLCIMPVNRYGRRRYEPVMNYIGTNPRECVEDDGILYWSNIEMPDDVPRHSTKVD